MTEEEIKKMQADLEAANANAKALVSKNERLEDESKKNKARAQTAEDKISADDKAKLEEQGKFEELLKVQREENKKLTSTLADRDNKVVRANIRAEVARHAKDAHSIERLLSVTEHKDLLKVNDDLSVEGAEAFVAKCRETDNFLFRKKSLKVTENKKGGGDDNKTGLEKYHAELDACSTREELNKVIQKYGKLK